jgi:hypothetical protein
LIIISFDFANTYERKMREGEKDLKRVGFSLTGYIDDNRTFLDEMNIIEKLWNRHALDRKSSKTITLFYQKAMGNNGFRYLLVSLRSK